jgi:hypothetical protein
MRTAEYVLYGITALGAVVWLLGLEYLIARRRICRPGRRRSWQTRGCRAC